MKVTKEQQRARRHARIRTKIKGTGTRPRLVIRRTLTNVYVQLIDDTQGKVIAASSSLKMKEKRLEAAKKVGMEVAKAALAKKISACVFDRAGYLYHGRVKALAEGAREGGLQF